MLTILGGSGFIGTRLANQLASQHIDFKIIDIKKSQLHPDKWLFGDVTKAETLLEPLKDASIIINLAAQHQDNVHPTSLYYDVNVDGAKNVCQVAEQLNIKQIIFTSSVAVYGFVAQETGEDGKFQPFNDYGKSKLAAEQVYDGWQAKDSQRTLVTIRPTVVFGEGNRGNVYNLFRQIAAGRFLMIGSGNNQKSMAYVENVAAFLYFVTQLKAGRHIFNYVDKPDFTMNQLTEIICLALQKQKSDLRIPYSLGLLAGYGFDLLAKIMGKNFPVSSIRVKKFCARTQFKSNTIAETGFEAPVTLAKGIENTVQFEFKHH
ncbi:NAD-dependent epimerase/dehydratase family protein [Arsenophonus nasoniae]|uniref:N-acetyl-alpha-D-glucosaminyl-diphospho-ditrans, octacis-undecaprenol 4-epimerase n=2 Tax=Arsenophonus nasoniae TaxID=638 RepID=D2U339_9GAMM|nr:NAD-dependent epimerase/dehydratase family protein [Arsenophonus nasoniae]QBY42215.1 N-acetyl-alpha-D-glucosaminyl-diphospho-ditrans,octacis-undecaprenol 4-epimerase [Arsenophonus nasoniae]WGM02107.1 NAD-dependent epimerase/dehydratase family protein [Arsenophonus nasoniae]WGM06372.1 NAD-dependent epimerase/dehydratase family protein [Arsenophonus nasoniae]WGM11305.1 NAD-dependent epimerase/dehydratase family protein [Arsenophonus nasoniae]WGM16005.1 NAD-dependent epimerase/dehydratase fami